MSKLLFILTLTLVSYGTSASEDCKKMASILNNNYIDLDFNWTKFYTAKRTQRFNQKRLDKLSVSPENAQERASASFDMAVSNHETKNDLVSKVIVAADLMDDSLTSSSCVRNNAFFYDVSNFSSIDAIVSYRNDLISFLKALPEDLKGKNFPARYR